MEESIILMVLVFLDRLPLKDKNPKQKLLYDVKYLLPPPQNRETTTFRIGQKPIFL